ncbi:neuronal acetylcholine receptor subunit beta-3-like [Zerene cesonia]|uniref:neuronal acetylcholine receptor subunit beta-3-like n=1 Tax=Zerene cesonia TaxID=33412 RepID=UPI0018E5129C|nr:neuronal acetylcholine receptor subunit beta-3-like [Zerene cesonia]
MAARQLVLISVLILFGCRLATCTCNNMTSFSTQLDTLLAEYDREILPSTPVYVRAALNVRHASIYDSSATLRLLADLRLSWEDKRVSWNASDWGCDTALTSADRLWVPDISILSTATLGPEMDTGLRAMLSSNGQISWLAHLDIKAPINLQLLEWPTDQQQAVFTFGSRSHSSDEINITISEFQHATVFESGSWELLKLRGMVSTWNGAGTDQGVVQWTVTLRRRAAAHALAVSTVMVTATVLLVAAAMLPPATRPPLCAAAAVIASLWLISALVRVPGASSAPLAMSLMCVVSGASAAAAACGALVLRVAACARPPPHLLRSLVTTVSTIVKLSPPEGSAVECSAWAAAAQLLDYVLLTLLLFTVFVVLCIYL